MDHETIKIFKVLGGLVLLVLGMGAALHKRKVRTSKSVWELKHIVSGMGDRNDYRDALLRLRELGEPIDFALPVILRIMLTDDLHDHRVGKNLLAEFFPDAMDGLHYNWLRPSRDARERLTQLLQSAEQQNRNIQTR